mmetsp:Transcript_14021/g.39483  ORF Transcript_14021/g.39483 Transcript_14021/m.39483 type:complete len:223 (-) Transcript_14021:147-815(-)
MAVLAADSAVVCHLMVVCHLAGQCLELATARMEDTLAMGRGRRSSSGFSGSSVIGTPTRRAGSSSARIRLARGSSSTRRSSQCRSQTATSLRWARLSASSWAATRRAGSSAQWTSGYRMRSTAPPAEALVLSGRAGGWPARSRSGAPRRAAASSTPATLRARSSSRTRRSSRCRSWTARSLLWVWKFTLSSATIPEVGKSGPRTSSSARWTRAPSCPGSTGR